MKWMNAIALIASVAVTHAQVGSVKIKLQALYDQSTALMLKKDLPKLKAFLKQTRTPDFTYTSPGKPSRKLPELLASMTSVLSDSNVRRAFVKIEDIKQDSTSATVKVMTLVELASQSSVDKQIHTVVQAVHGVDRWVKAGGQWKLKLSHVVAENLLRDGRRVPN